MVSRYVEYFFLPPSSHLSLLGLTLSQNHLPPPKVVTSIMNELDGLGVQIVLFTPSSILYTPVAFVEMCKCERGDVKIDLLDVHGRI